uniref:SYPL1 n=1 Tax=Angiostrongylus cantonensis TaxID=6313 RepID=A0A0K0DDD4_ANGCA
LTIHKKLFFRTSLFLIACRPLLREGQNTEGTGDEWILNGDNKRDTLFTANAEGICSLMGYITIFYISDAVAKFVSKTGIRVKSWVECCWRLYIFAFIFYIMQLGAEWTLGQPCRRVVNISYVFAQMSFFTFTLICNCLLFPDENPWYGVQPCLSTSVNKSGLIFFLLANIFTGAVNLAVDTHHTDDITAICILVGYLFCLCIIAHYRTKMNTNC